MRYPSRATPPNLIPRESNDSPVEESWEYFFEQAEKTTESHLDVNLAFFPGAIQGPGAISNIREENLTVGHLARASLEQMATYYHQLSNRIDPRNLRSGLAFSGGIAQQSSLLRELIASRLNSGFRLATTSEDALYGMLVLGRVIEGLNATVADSTEAVASLLSSGADDV